MNNPTKARPGVLAVIESVSRDRNGIPALDEARTAVERLVEAAAAAVENVEAPRLRSELRAALAPFKGASNVSNPEG